MQADMQGMAYALLLLICMAPFASHAAPAVSGFANEGLSLYTPPRTPSSSSETRNHTFTSNYSVGKRAFSIPGSELDRRDGERHYLADFYPRKSPPRWEVRVENDPELDPLPGTGFYVSGIMEKLESKPIGVGSQGEVFEGQWKSFIPPVKWRKVDKVKPSWEQPAAIKVSSNTVGYSTGEFLTEKVKSPYVISVLGYGLDVSQGQIKTQSVVAYEKMDLTANQMLACYPDFDRIPFIRAIMEGQIDLLEAGLINMDLKFDNLMIKSAAQRMKNAEWKIIDVDVAVSASSEKETNILGALGIMAPEVLQRRKEYNPAAAMVFMTAMVVYYAVQGRFEQEVTGEMRKFISDEMEVYDYGQDFGPDHVEWTWVALLGYKAPGISSRDTKRPKRAEYLGLDQTDVAKILPDQYQQGAPLAKWGQVFVGALCKEDQRTDLRQMWRDLKPLLPDLDDKKLFPQLHDEEPFQQPSVTDDSDTVMAEDSEMEEDSETEMSE